MVAGNVLCLGSTPGLAGFELLCKCQGYGVAAREVDVLFEGTLGL